MQKLKRPKNSLKLFLFNVCFFEKHFEDLEYLLKSASINYDIIAISEKRTMKNLKLLKISN